MISTLVELERLMTFHPAIRSRGPKATKVDPETILDAALEVFARDGLKGGSIRAIANEAGCDPALIYYHFQNKEAMFAALLDRRFPPLTSDLQKLANPKDTRHTAERLWGVLSAIHAHLAQDAGFRALVRGELVCGAEGIRNSIAQRVQPVFQALCALFQQGIQRGHIRPNFPPQLGPFFFLRLYIEILDLVPIMSERIAKIAPEQALPMARQEWFRLFWRGAATRPEEPLPFLNGFTELTS